MTAGLDSVGGRILASKAGFESIILCRWADEIREYYCCESDADRDSNKQTNISPPCAKSDRPDKRTPKQPLTPAQGRVLRKV
jgi:hypothetical protein